jgi:hypothetical protein
MAITMPNKSAKPPRRGTGRVFILRGPGWSIAPSLLANLMEKGTAIQVPTKADNATTAYQYQAILLRFSFVFFCIRRARVLFVQWSTKSGKPA